MRKVFVVLGLLLVRCVSGFQTNDRQTGAVVNGQTKSQWSPDVVVVGSWEQAPFSESDRSVETYPLHNSLLLFGSLTDALALDSSVQVQARAPNGVQGDVSIRGGNFGQTLILLNGIRMSDAQSAHHNLDIPVPLDSVERVEVLRGSGSTLYGSEAVGGVINVVTRPSAESTPLELRLRAGYGSFGTNEQSGFLAIKEGVLSQRFSFEREFSKGFRNDRDYRNLALGSESWIASRPGLTRIFFSILDRPFGADQFYGNYNSWERTKTWLADLSQDLGKKTLFTFGYRRHTDLYVLLRENPAYYTNRHEDETWDATLRRHDTLWRTAQIYYGGEGWIDHVESNNLGTHSRKRAAIYGDLDIRSWHRLSLSVGTRQEFYGRAQTIAVPSASAAYWISSRAKLRASISRAFRLPNYTDLYYHDPANSGNPNLKPERAMSYEGGLDLHLSQHWRGSITGFVRRESNDIDYIRANSASIWQAENFARVNLAGVEATLAWSLPYSQNLKVEYTGLHGAEAALNGFQSKYVFNYPTQQAVAGWEHLSSSGWVGRIRAGVTNLYQRDAYLLVDAYFAWTRSRVHPYLRLTNLTNSDYQPVYGVAMPGRAGLVGLEFCVLCGKP